MLDRVLPNGESKSCTLHDVLYVPALSYNLCCKSLSEGLGEVH